MHSEAITAAAVAFSASANNAQCRTDLEAGLVSDSPGPGPGSAFRCPTAC